MRYSSRSRMVLTLWIVLLGTSLVTSQTPDVFTWDAGKAATTTPQATYAPPATTPTPNLTSECRTRAADLVFLLDSSGSEGQANFNEQLKFISNIVKNFDIGPDAVQVSVATFATGVQNEFWLDQYENKTDVINAINNIKYNTGVTATDQALQFALNESFAVDHGARNDSNKILIVLTDGQSTNSKATLEAANQIHNTDVRVIAIGIGGNIDPAELSSIATDDKHVFTVANFTGLASIEKEVAYKTCKTEGLLCKSTPADILFLLDSSGSEGTTNFQKQLDFVKNFAKDFDIGPNAVQIAVTTFATTTHSEFWFSDYQNKSALLTAIDNIKFNGGNTETAQALKLGETAFTATNGARNNSNHLIIMLTDGQSTNKAETKQEANKIHNAGIQVITIGIGNSIDQQEIKDIASGDGGQNAFSVANFDALHTIEKEIQQRTCKEQKQCSTHPTDVVFLLDSSASEGSANFQKQLDFVNNFAKELDIGPNNVLVSVVTFATTVKNEFYLNKHTTKADLENSIVNIKYHSGTTNTHLGLKYIREHNFLPQNGGRPDANQVVIVITDGHPNNRLTTASEAKLLHQAGVKVISVGIGSHVDNTELTDLASASELVFKVANFDSLHKIEAQILTSTCTSHQTSCKSEPSDIVFLLDSSSSEGSDNFKKQLDFVNKFVDGFDIGPNAVQFGLVTFSTAITNRFFLSDFNNKAALKAAISRVPYTAGNTDTGDGLEFVRTQSLSATHGARPNAHQVVIVMTDGQSQKTAATTQQAKLLRDAGVKVIAVGIGNGINSAELQSIASDPQHVFTVAGFNALQTIEKELQKTTCNQLGCATREADIVFVLDSSGSEGITNFRKQLSFVHDFIEKFEVSTSAVQFSIIVFSTGVYPDFDLNKYSSKAPLLAAVNATAYHTGVTYTDKALHYAHNHTLTDAYGARPNATKIVIVMTDGMSSNAAQTRIEANKLHQDGVEVLAIGIGRSPRQTELQAIASDYKHVFSVANFDALKTIQNELQAAACAVQTTGPSTTPTTPQCGPTEKADVVFVVDAASGIGAANFRKELQFLSTFVNHYAIGPNNMQVGVVKYSTSGRVEFYLNSHRTKSSLLYAIPQIQYTGGLTRTNLGLYEARRYGFSSTYGARPGVSKYAIVIVNGKSASTTSTLREATNLKNMGVKVIAIGVGSQVLQSELNGIATDPSHVITVPTFDALLSTKVQQVEGLTC